jgi:glycosyltransferase involved in cell wall biosynthesis
MGSAMKASVVIPVYDGEETLAACLHGLREQSFPQGEYEVIVVNDGSSDNSAAVAAQFGVRLLEQDNQGAPAARNLGLAHAHGDWVAFTDADCIPSRSWLASLVAAAEGVSGGTALGAAGRTVGYNSTHEAARFVDLMGGLDAARHLSHPSFPFAPSGNMMYRRSILERIGGFDSRYCAYDACDLHARARRVQDGPFPYVAHAVVLHRHRGSWPAYWKQQRNYGRGLAQFMWKYRADVRWPLSRELAAWAKVAKTGVQACWPGSDDAAIARRGTFLRTFAQRLGFAATYWNPAERSRW